MRRVLNGFCPKVDNSPHAREQYLDEEQALLEAGDYTSQPSPTTLLEGVLDLVKRQIDCKGQQLPAADNPAGEDDTTPSPATRVTGDLYVALDELHEVLAKALDTADKFYDVQSDRKVGEV